MVKETYMWALIMFVVGVMLGYAWRIHHEDKIYKNYVDLKQFEIELKEELKTEKPLKFFIRDTNIHITKRKDGTGIIRIGGNNNNEY